MKSVTIDIINGKALQLLKELEALQLIRLRKPSTDPSDKNIDWSAYKGALRKESIDKTEAQLKALREGWE